MALDVRDFVLVNAPRTLLVPTGSGVFAPRAHAVHWSQTFTGTASVTVLVENEDLLTADELTVVCDGEAEIAAGAYVTLTDLEKSLDE